MKEGLGDEVGGEEAGVAIIAPLRSLVKEYFPYLCLSTTWPLHRQLFSLLPRHPCCMKPFSFEFVHLFVL